MTQVEKRSGDTVWLDLAFDYTGPGEFCTIAVGFYKARPAGHADPVRDIKAGHRFKKWLKPSPDGNRFSYRFGLSVMNIQAAPGSHWDVNVAIGPELKGSFGDWFANEKWDDDWDDDVLKVVS